MDKDATQILFVLLSSVFSNTQINATDKQLVTKDSNKKPSRVFRHPRMTSHIPVVPVASGLPAFFISEDILKKP